MPVSEKRPQYPIRWMQPLGSMPYKVKDGDDWASVALKFNVKGGNGPHSVPYLIFFNFYVYCDIKHGSAARSGITDEVNWYLREYVGCNITKDEINWAFSDSANPGIIYIPQRAFDFEGDGLVVAGSSGVGTTISVPQYNDHTFYDTISKAFDIVGSADMGANMLEIIPDAGIVGGADIALGAITAFLGPFVALGSGDADALKHWTREYFFGGFAIGLVMSANGASEYYIKSHEELQYPPANSAFPAKRETFRKLYNAGLILGIRKGKKFNTVDQRNFFTYLHSKLSATDRDYFNPKKPWKEWSESKRKEYYDTVSGIVKHQMLNNNLQFKFPDYVHGSR